MRVADDRQYGRDVRGAAWSVRVRGRRGNIAGKRGEQTMDKNELLERLAEIRRDDDIEEGHYAADQALLDFINDDDISAAYSAIKRWYA